jgi:hypothetical protein
MRVIMHKRRTWLANHSHRVIPAEPHYTASRRLSMPEQLEGRNAPSAMLALLPVFGASVVVDDNKNLLLAEPPRPEAQTYYRSNANPTPPVQPFSIENFVNALRAAELEGQQGQTHIDTARQATEFRTPAQIAAVSMAFDSFEATDYRSIFFDARLIPPPIIHPVEPPEEEPEPLTTPEAITTPLPPENAVDSHPAMEVPVSTDEEADVTPPPVIQPVITAPESEHNQPSPDPANETPPPLTQPVIMDPESEHNQELNLADAVR